MLSQVKNWQVWFGRCSYLDKEEKNTKRKKTDSKSDIERR